ncbi:MAG: oligogalacturonate lyase family protein [Burkholderiales bacterium]|nr:oligogalacturonate lyase family protein [Burkholderiales bacterium]
MGKGAVFPSEARWSTDPETGTRIRQVTAHRSIHHHPFFFVPAWDDAMRRLVFVSHRTGVAQLYAEIQDDGCIVQLTDRDDLVEWSFYPSHDGTSVFFVAGTGAWRLDLATFEEECLADFGRVRMRERGMVGAAMGTTALSSDDRWWAIPVKAERVARFHIVDTRRGGAEVILERDTIGHPQFHPDDTGLLFYAGPLTNRIWVVGRDGSGSRNPYPRTDSAQWITHESWIPGTRELAFVDWPRGMKAVNVDTGAVRDITRFPAWHAVADCRGERIVCDTTFPDRGLHVFPVRGAEHAVRRLCCPRSSNAGAHWGGPFPYNDGPREVYAPQHTHPPPALLARRHARRLHFRC